MNIYFSPHPDDVVLSCGGRLLSEDEALVVNVFAGNYKGLTEWDKLCGLRKEAIKQRKEEDKRILSSLGFNVLNLDFLDIAVYKDLRSDFRSKSVESKLIEEIEDLISDHKPQKLFFPMGMGHEDHRLLNSIGERFVDLNRCFYADIPYSLNSKIQNYNKYKLSKEEMTKKLNLILRYKTQIKGFLKLTNSNSIEEFKSKLANYHEKESGYIEKFIEK